MADNDVVTEDITVFIELIWSNVNIECCVLYFLIQTIVNENFLYTDRRTVCVVQMDSTECARKLAELVTCVICESNTSEKLTKLTPLV